MKPLFLQIELLSEWHVGTGTGAGPGVDLAVHRDPQGLPCLPGRAARGLIRDAWRERAELCGDPAFAALGVSLFGDHTHERPGEDCARGCLDVRDAVLASAVAAWLIAGGPARIGRLFRVRKSTAMDPISGTAKPKSLRSMEVAVPVTLFAPLRVLTALAPEGLAKDWPGQIAEVCTLIRGLGLRRSRGLGRCRFKIKEAGAAS